MDVGQVRLVRDNNTCLAACVGGNPASGTAPAYDPDALIPVKYAIIERIDTICFQIYPSKVEYFPYGRRGPQRNLFCSLH